MTNHRQRRQSGELSIDPLKMIVTSPNVMHDVANRFGKRRFGDDELELEVMGGKPR
jgi:hypothetical protein